MMLTHLVTDKASEYNVLTLDIGLGKDASSMYLHRVIANQVQKSDRRVQRSQVEQYGSVPSA